MINKTLPQYKLFFRIYINKSKHWEYCMLIILEWQWQSGIFKELPQPFF